MEVLKHPPIVVTDSNEIDALLAEAERNWARTSVEYEIGVRDGYAMAQQATMKDAFEKMILPAETFLLALKRLLPEVVTKQVRIGLDYSSGKPAAVFILHAEAQELHERVMDLARDMEIFFWERHKSEANLWTLLDDKLDQEAVERDFPLKRPDGA